MLSRCQVACLDRTRVGLGRGASALADWKLRLLQVEHIIREENMMAAQEILELFCELIAVRLPIIEAQKFVPLSEFDF
jgi:hypothetical protein